MTLMGYCWRRCLKGFGRMGGSRDGHAEGERTVNYGVLLFSGAAWKAGTYTRLVNTSYT
jgi:hypothetical protein